MLKEGMAVVYTSGGGEYGPWGLDGMKAVEAQAKWVEAAYSPHPSFRCLI